ncbi:GDSL-like Lipase/Acylhydrolase superfamily protein [Striga hermonthica]|uniref:GDSL-like Lipase/Acylhydrolase superfamily protein n=1 Tax=Striga hermonthica TaxID=68872 RepID=A0A9N7NZA0_STRHE|nr:GDSL-like Lipase/Acylhydrolase superfamily protein [Striga hermonthica]
MGNQTPSYPYLFKIVCFYLVLQFGMTLSQGPKCPFSYLYHFGDGFTDIGNCIHVVPKLKIPPGGWPYGKTFPGYPTGRWSDGRVDFDFTAVDFGLPDIVPYLGMNKSAAASHQGVIFSTGGSPVLDLTFFLRRNIVIPPYALSLKQQLVLFREHLDYVCSSPAECSKWIGESMVLMGDIEGNDIGYALTQGKSIQEVRSYVPAIVKTLIDVSREVIKLGATRVIIPGNIPVGCYPYILTELQTRDRNAYDEIGCLKSVNDLIVWKNGLLNASVEDLKKEYPNVLILYSTMYEGPFGNSALKSCCGIGGKYNYDSRRFCGNWGVPVCSNPSDYLFWDGRHFTDESNYEIEQRMIAPALELFNCTPLSAGFSRRTRDNIVQVVDFLSSM